MMTCFKRLQVTDNETGKVLSEWETTADKADNTKVALERKISVLGLNFTVNAEDLS